MVCPQLNASLVAGPDDPRDSATLRIETRNELPATLPEMLAALRLVRIWLGAKFVSESRIVEFAGVLEGQSQDDLIKNFQMKVDYLKLQKVHGLVSESKFDEAQVDIDRLLGNNEASVESKFSFLQEQERLEYMRSRKADAPQGTTPEIHLRTSKKLQALTKDGPKSLKFFALIARKAGELDILTFRDLGLSMNWLGHVRGSGDPAIAIQLAVQRLLSINRIVRAYNQCVRLATYASQSEHQWAVPQALLRIVDSTSAFVLRLRWEGLAAEAKQYTESAMQICKLSVWIAERQGDDDVLSRAVVSSMLLTDKYEENADIIKFANETLAKIKDRRQLQITKEIFDRAVRRMGGERVEGDAPTDVLKQIVENRATGLGIDMANPNDPIAKLVRLGIKDANPERALRHCEHSLISIRGTSSPVVYGLSQTLQMPSIMGKRIHCDLHDYVAGDDTLDGAFEKFKQRYCDSCPDVVPRAIEWKYSDEWQERENLRHAGFMAKFYQKRTRGPGS